MDVLDQSVPFKTTKVIRQYLSDNREPRAINVELNRMQYNGLKYAELLVSHIEDDLRDTILDRRVYFLGSSGINDITDYTETTEYLQATIEPADDDDFLSYIVPIAAGKIAFDIVIFTENNQFDLYIDTNVKVPNDETTYLPL